MSEQPQLKPEPQAQPKVVIQPARPKLLWRPLQRLRAAVGLIPSAETEVLAQLVVAMQFQMQLMSAKQKIANNNFEQIRTFMNLTNNNAINIDKNYKMLLERIQAVEKVLRLRAEDEPDDGSYVV